MRSRMSFTAIALIATAAASSVFAAGEGDWPCVQRNIPALSAGMMWAGPPIDQAAETLAKTDPEISNLAARLAARRTSLDEAEKLIETFAAAVAGDDKPARLTALFAGVLGQINTERQLIMAGIRKYTRKQKTLAAEIGKTRAELKEALNLSPVSDADRKARREIEERLGWQSRIHRERERSLIFVCESPVILEQRAFSIARSIAAHLE